MIIENTTTIARPGAEVFAFVSDVRNDPQWHNDVLEAQLPEGESVGKDSGVCNQDEALHGGLRGNGSGLGVRTAASRRVQRAYGKDGSHHHPDR